MLLRNPFYGAFGLDIGDQSIKLVRLSRQRNLKLRPFFKVEELREISLPPGFIVDGEILQPEMVRRKLLLLLNQKSPGFLPSRCRPWVVADLPEPKTFIKMIGVEVPPAELTADDVLYQARKHLPFDLGEAYLDWQAVGSVSDKKSRVLIGAVPKTIANTYTLLLESVELRPIALEIEALATVRAMITLGKDYQNEARAIIDLGATRSSFMVYDQMALQFSNIVNFSGEMINAALQEELKIDRDAAEEMKIKNGLFYDPKNPRYLKIVTDLAGILTAEIEKNVSFYREHFPHGNPITHITMAGGLANLKNLDNFISRRLKIAAHPGQAWKNLSNLKISENLKTKGPAFASAIGLALRAAINPLGD